MIHGYRSFPNRPTGEIVIGVIAWLLVCTGLFYLCLGK